MDYILQRRLPKNRTPSQRSGVGRPEQTPYLPRRIKLTSFNHSLMCTLLPRYSDLVWGGTATAVSDNIINLLGITIHTKPISILMVL